MLLRQHKEDQRIQIEEEDMEKIMSQGMGPSDIMDDKHEVRKQLLHTSACECNVTFHQSLNYEALVRF